MLLPGHKVLGFDALFSSASLSSTSAPSRPVSELSEEEWRAIKLEAERRQQEALKVERDRQRDTVQNHLVDAIKQVEAVILVVKDVMEVISKGISELGATEAEICEEAELKMTQLRHGLVGRISALLSLGLKVLDQMSYHYEIKVLQMRGL